MRYIPVRSFFIWVFAIIFIKCKFQIFLRNASNCYADLRIIKQPDWSIYQSPEDDYFHGITKPQIISPCAASQLAHVPLHSKGTRHAKSQAVNDLEN